MSPEDDNNERPNNEIDPIRRQINERTNASLESTRNMVALATETHEVGVKTLVMLGEQGEKLSRIEVSFIYNVIFSKKNLLEWYGYYSCRNDKS